MSTVEQEPIVGELIESRAVDRLPVLFSVTDANIEQLRNECFGLVIQTSDDYKKCVSLIAVARSMRVATKNCKEQLKKDAIAYGRRVDSEFTRITARLEAIENPLKAEKSRVDDAKELAKKQEAEAKQRALQVRIDALAVVGHWTNPLIVETWSVEQYDEALATATDTWETKLRKEASDKAEAYRIETERVQAIRLERIAIEAERAELEKLREEQAAKEWEERVRKKIEDEKLAADRAAQQAEIDEENMRARDAIVAARQALQVERDRIEKEEQERQEERRYEIKRAEHAAEQDRQHAIAIDFEVKRIEALKPDAEKLKILSDTLRLLAYPTMATNEGEKCLLAIVRRISETAEYCSECLS